MLSRYKPSAFSIEIKIISFADHFSTTMELFPLATILAAFLNFLLVRK
jgi:hypothetical protein